MHIRGRLVAENFGAPRRDIESFETSGSSGSLGGHVDEIASCGLTACSLCVSVDAYYMLDCLPIVDKQLALYEYWKGIGGTVMLLGM